jgi:hypothetical protein
MEETAPATPWVLRNKGASHFWVVKGVTKNWPHERLDLHAAIAALNEQRPDLGLQFEARAEYTTVRWAGAASHADGARVAIVAAMNEMAIRRRVAAAAAGLRAPREPPYVTTPPGASEEGVEEFKAFASAIVGARDDFVGWVPPDAELDALLAGALSARHALERVDERMAQGIVELQRSLRSPSHAAYRAVARTMRYRLFVSGVSFLFNSTCTRLLKHEHLGYEQPASSAPLPTPLAEAAIAALAAAAEGNSPSYSARAGLEPLSFDLAELAGAALGGPAGGSGASARVAGAYGWREDNAVVALTTSGRFVFSHGGRRLATFIAEPFAVWRAAWCARKKPPQAGTDIKAKAAEARRAKETRASPDLKGRERESQLKAKRDRKERVQGKLEL